MLLSTHRATPARFYACSAILKTSRQLVCCFLFFVTAIASAQVTATVNSTFIKIGEEILYTIEVQADTTATVVFPEGQSFLPLEVIDAYKTDTTYEQSTYRLIKKYGLTQFDSGSYTIPRQRVSINGTPYFTDSVSVEIRNVVVDTTKQKMYDIKAAMEVKEPTFNWLKLFFWLLPILIILGLIAYFLFRRKKRKAARENQLPPYEEAIVALKNLDNSALLKENRSKEYYSHLTEIVKRYLDREVDETALESTSDELILRLQMHKDAGHFKFDNETIRHLDQVLKRADLVKFAKMHQESGQAEADRRTVESIIHETHEALPEPTEEELLANEAYAEKVRKKRRRRKIIIGIVAGVALLIVTSFALIGYFGYSYLKDTVLGHPLQELVEGRWIKSEYGNPAVVIETPKVLVRADQPIPEELQNVISSNSTFVYGSLLSNFYMMVNTVEYQQAIDPDLDAILEGSLQNIEQRGASNLVIKKEEFSTNQGIQGLKGFGTFSSELVKGNGETEQQYQLLVFGQKGAVQQIMISYPVDNEYAEQMVERIITSIELQVSEANPQTPQQ